MRESICPTAMFLLMKYTQSKFLKSSFAPIFDSQTDGGESDDIDAHHPPLVSPENNNAHDPHHRHHDHHDHDHKHDADAEAEAEGYAGAEGEAESEAEAEAAYGTGNKN